MASSGGNRAINASEGASLRRTSAKVPRPPGRDNARSPGRGRRAPGVDWGRPDAVVGPHGRPRMTRAEDLARLSPRERLRLLRFVASFAWSDLAVTAGERAYVHRLVSRLHLTPEEALEVEGWLKSPRTRTTWTPRPSRTSTGGSSRRGAGDDRGGRRRLAGGEGDALPPRAAHPVTGVCLLAVALAVSSSGAPARPATPSRPSAGRRPSPPGGDATAPGPGLVSVRDGAAGSTSACPRPAGSRSPPAAPPATTRSASSTPPGER